jgi:hypothetical protein
VPEWWNGRRAGLKIRWGQPREGSSPSSGTMKFHIYTVRFPSGPAVSPIGLSTASPGYVEGMVKATVRVSLQYIAGE